MDRYKKGFVFVSVAAFHLLLCVKPLLAPIVAGALYAVAAACGGALGWFGTAPHGRANVPFKTDDQSDAPTASRADHMWSPEYRSGFGHGIANYDERIDPQLYPPGQ